MVGGWLVFVKRKRLEESLQTAEQEAERANNAKSRFFGNDQQRYAPEIVDAESAQCSIAKDYCGTQDCKLFSCRYRKQNSNIASTIIRTISFSYWQTEANK